MDTGDLEKMVQLAVGESLTSRVLQVLLLLWFCFYFVPKILIGIETLITRLRTHTPEDEQRILFRQRFAEHVENEIRLLNNREDWKDYKYAELEAEVEADATWRPSGLKEILRISSRGLRRERSLSRALELTQDRLILLEGDPGSGKSVALRYVTQTLASRAKGLRSFKSVIPLYINLKGLERLPNEVVDRNLIESYILSVLNRVNDRDVASFLDHEFTNGLGAGTWLFLFDSFDEIPEVLSSTEGDQIVSTYSSALSDFLHGMNQCRGIIASRHFRGPDAANWPKFRILDLSDSRQEQLIRRSGLMPAVQNTLRGNLGTASEDVRKFTRNPMLLALLCEHMKSGHMFPESAHTIFETYIAHRFRRDRESVSTRFSLDIDYIRTIAQSVAFCMSLDLGLGLSPTRFKLRLAMTRNNIAIDEKLDTALDALEFMKIGQTDAAIQHIDNRIFTFAHRRFQEYFATCVVLAAPNWIDSDRLLTDARWRETAVVMFQTQPMQAIAPLLTRAEFHLLRALQLIPDVLEDAKGYVSVDRDMSAVENVTSLPSWFPWPEGSLHLLGILQSGFGNRLLELEPEIRNLAAQLLLTVTVRGSLRDRVWALEVAGIVPEEVLVWMLRNAFASNSQILQDVAYQQTARLSRVPQDILQSIRRALISLAANDRIRREYYSIRTHIHRLQNSSRLESVLQLLRILPSVDIALNTVIFVPIMITSAYLGRFDLLLASLALFLVSLISMRLLSQSLRRHYDTGALYSYTMKRRISRGSERRKSTSMYNSMYSHLSTSALLSSLGLGVAIFLIVRLFLGLSIGAGTFWILDSNESASTRLAAFYTYGAPVRLGVTISLTWAAFAVMAARTDTMVYPICWPFLTLSPVVHFLKNSKNFLQIIRIHWETLLVALVSASGVALLIYFLQDVLEALFQNYLLYIVVPTTTIFLVSSALPWIVDVRRAISWIGRPNIVISIEEFLEIFGSMRTNWFKIWSFQWARKKQLLLSGTQTMRALESLALLIERNNMSRLLRKAEGPDTPAFPDRIVGTTISQLEFDRSDPVILWYSNHIEAGKPLPDWSAEVLDEAYLIQRHYSALNKE